MATASSTSLSLPIPPARLYSRSSLVTARALLRLSLVSVLALPQRGSPLEILTATDSRTSSSRIASVDPYPFSLPRVAAHSALAPIFPCQAGSSPYCSLISTETASSIWPHQTSNLHRSIPCRFCSAREMAHSDPTPSIQH